MNVCIANVLKLDPGTEPFFSSMTTACYAVSLEEFHSTVTLNQIPLFNQLRHKFQQLKTWKQIGIVTEMIPDRCLFNHLGESLSNTTWSEEADRQLEATFIKSNLRL